MICNLPIAIELNLERVVESEHYVLIQFQKIKIYITWNNEQGTVACFDLFWNIFNTYQSQNLITTIYHRQKQIFWLGIFKGGQGTHDSWLPYALALDWQGFTLPSDEHELHR